MTSLSLKLKACNVNTIGILLFTVYLRHWTQGLYKGLMQFGEFWRPAERSRLREKLDIATLD
jgi:hypothetical protein